MTDWLEELLKESGEALRWALGRYPSEGQADREEAGTALAGMRQSREAEAQSGEETLSAWEAEDLPAWERAGLELAASPLLQRESGETPLWDGEATPSNGLEAGGSGLYRRLARAVIPAQKRRASGQTAAAERQSVGTPSLTVDELDRAVRRDSRRYDGGMELY